MSKDISSLPLAMGGLGLPNTSRTSQSAFWADSLSMIRERHPTVAAFIVRTLQRWHPLFKHATHLSGVQGFGPPSWEVLVQGARPPEREPEDFEPGGTRSGW